MTTMNRIWSANQLQSLARCAHTGEDIMAPKPVSIGYTEKVQRAAAVLTDRGVSAAAVINEAGHPVGVVSQTDIVRVAGGELSASRCALLCDDCGSLGMFLSGVRSEELDPGGCECPRVREIMTSEVFSIEKNAPVVRVVEEFLSRNVQRLFVVDDEGALVGVVTALDVLRSLRR